MACHVDKSDIEEKYSKVFYQTVQKHCRENKIGGENKNYKRNCKAFSLHANIANPIISYEDNKCVCSKH